MLHKILKIVAIILSVLGAVWLVRIILAGDTAITDSMDLQNSLVTPFIYIAFVVLGISVLFVVIFVLKNLFSNAKSLKSTLIGLGAFAAVIAISFVLAEGQEYPLQDGEVLSASGSRWVETGIYAFYILAVLAVGSMVFSGVRKLAK